MRTIYIVTGRTGEYSTYSEWPVRAYYKKELAEAHITKADQRASEIEAKYKDAEYSNPQRYREKNKYDPNMPSGYDSVEYFLYEVPISTTKVTD